MAGSECVKIHEPDSSTKLVENWQNIPGYEFAQFVAKKKLLQFIQLPSIFIIKNTVEVVKIINNILFNDNIRLVSFDIKNMYPKISTGGGHTVA